MKAGSREPDGGADLSSPGDGVSVCGPIQVLRTRRDIRGVERTRPQWILSPRADAVPDPVRTETLAAALADADAVYLQWPPARAVKLDGVLPVLEEAGFRHDALWPMAPPPGPMKSLDLRVSRSRPHAATAFALTWAAQRNLCSVAAEKCKLVAEVQSVIERAAARTFLGTPFDRRCRVLDIMTVGSTSRGTYTDFPPDFDLVVNTEEAQASMDPAEVRAGCDRLLAALAETAAYRRYVAAIEGEIGMGAGAGLSIVLQSFGARGPQSLVARYVLVAQARGADRHLPFLDITFGRLPQLVGYELWIRQLFDRLGERASEHLRAEIRVAKSILKKLGDVYGSANRGLKAHAIEQWIIQSFDYRPSGTSVGTFDNALKLILEEGVAGGRKAAPVVAPFADFKVRFPLWHPGWWGVAGSAAGPRMVNLWDLLGDGDAVAGEQKWRKLVALALAYDGAERRDEAGGVNDLVRCSGGLLASLGGG